jgi:hypothetical protein
VGGVGGDDDGDDGEFMLAVWASSDSVVDDCRFSNRVSPRVPLTCGDAGCLRRCHRAFVSNSCPFLRDTRWYAIRSSCVDHHSSGLAAERNKRDERIRQIAKILTEEFTAAELKALAAAAPLIKRLGDNI